MRIGWLSFHIVGGKALTHLLNTNRLVDAVITLSEKKISSRSGVFDYSPLCSKYNLPIYKIDHINSNQSIDLLRQLDLDILFVIGWSQIIEKEILDIPRLGMVGVHSSFLPQYRGSAPINWAIINGEKETGTTLMVLSEGVDTGNIIDQISFPITLYDSCKTLYDKVAKANVKMILNLYDNLHNGNFSHQPQNKNALEKILPRRTPKDGLIDWNNNSIELYNFIRAQTSPYPGAYSYINDIKYFILKCASFPKLDNNLSFTSGEIIGPIYSTNIDACGILVKCNGSFLLILEISDEQGNNIRGKILNNFFTKGSIFSSKKSVS